MIQCSAAINRAIILHYHQRGTVFGKESIQMTISLKRLQLLSKHRSGVMMLHVHVYINNIFMMQ